MRPYSMTVFDRIYWAMIVIGLLGGAVNWQAAMTTITTNPGLGMLGNGAVMGILIGSVLLGLVINVLLWYFISRRVSNTARWIWVVLAAIGLPGSLRIIFAGNTQITLPGAGRAIVAINIVLQIAAAVMLFRAESRAWFARGGAAVDIDAFN